MGVWFACSSHLVSLPAHSASMCLCVFAEWPSVPVQVAEYVQSLGCVQGGSNPRYDPMLKTIRNIEQRIQRESCMHPDDATSTYAKLFELSGLQAGEHHDSKSIGKHSCVFYQKFECHCHDSSKCLHGPRCKPHYSIQQTDWQRVLIVELDRKGHLARIHLDATGQTNCMRWQTYVVVAQDEFGRGVPIASMITSTNSHEAVTVLLDALHKVCPAFRPQQVVVDDADSVILGVRNCVFKPAVRICFFHLMQAWKRWITSKRVNDSQHETILSFIRRMKLACTDDKFMELHAAFVAYLEHEGMDHVQQYYDREWNGKKALWCDAYASHVSMLYNGDTNNLIERFFRTMKYSFLKGKTNKRIDTLVDRVFGWMHEHYLARTRQLLGQREENWPKNREIYAREKKVRCA